MSGLKHGRVLGCGCVVGEYWCGPHDIYARRSEPTTTWNGFNGNYYWKTLPPNDHKPLSDFSPVRSEPDDYHDGPGCCSCHINPPCSWCIDQPDPDEEEATS